MKHMKLFEWVSAAINKGRNMNNNKLREFKFAVRSCKVKLKQDGFKLSVRLNSVEKT